MLKMEFGRSTSTFVFMLCFQARSHLLFNGVDVGAFFVHRSVRQGCPLAPLLFVILTHPLVLALEDAVAKGLIKGLVLPDGSNLLEKLFADDSLLFLNANNDVIKNALIIVDEFASASMQC